MARIVEVRESTVRLEAPHRNAVMDFRGITGSLVAVLSDQHRHGRRVTGFGFNSIGRYAQGEAIRDRFAPRLRGETLDPARVRDLLMVNEKPGGHGDRSAAVAAIEVATWDLAAKLAEWPAYRLVADAFGRPAPSPVVKVYAAGGYYSDDGGIAALQNEIRGYLELGYEQVKIKIGDAPLAEDLRRIEAVLALVGDGGGLAVDANARFDLATAVRYGEALQQYGLRWFEEPGDPLDYGLQADLGRRLDLPFATGENLFSRQDVRNLLRHGGLHPDRDFLQMDPGLGYGVTEYRAMLGEVDDFGWTPERVLPHGGNLVGLHMAAAFGLGGSEAYPGVFQPFGGFGSRMQVTSGTVEIPDAPGFGFEEKSELRPLLAEVSGQEAV